MVKQYSSFRLSSRQITQFDWVIRTIMLFIINLTTNLQEVILIN